MSPDQGVEMLGLLLPRTGLRSVWNNNNPKSSRAPPKHFIDTHDALPTLGLQIYKSPACKLANPAYALEYASILNMKTCALRRFKINRIEVKCFEFQSSSLSDQPGTFVVQKP